MRKYNPAKTPDREEWLALDDTERLGLVKRFHKKHGDYGESLEMHSIIHSVVESQLAQNIQPVADAFGRLRKDEMVRHDAVHAIGSVLTEHIYEILHGDETGGDANERYYEKLSTLTKKWWYEHYSEDE